jgi:hypothetical protein
MLNSSKLAREIRKHVLMQVAVLSDAKGGALISDVRLFRVEIDASLRYLNQQCLNYYLPSTFWSKVDRGELPVLRLEARPSHHN